jgi:hypothetical protein
MVDGKGERVTAVWQTGGETMTQHVEKGHPDLAAFMKNTRDKRMDSAGKTGQWTQPYVAKLMHVHKDKYAKFESGEQMPSIRELGRWGEVLQLNRQEWEQLEYYIRTALQSEISDISPLQRPNTICVVFDETEDQIARPSCLEKFYMHAQFPPRAGIRFPFTRPTSIITPTYTHPDSNLFTVVPEDDREAAGIIEALLRRFDIETKSIPCSAQGAPQNPADYEMILVGGPGRNSMSDKINVQLRAVPWFQGFYFHPEPASADETEHRRMWWAIRHRADPEVDISEKTIILTHQGRDREYRSFAEELSLEFGIIYAGPNPYNHAYWLLMSAGLGPVGTFAAAEALTTPHVIPFLTQALLTRYVYCSILVQYYFEPHHRHDGNLTSVIVTMGQVPSSRERQATNHG